MKKTENKRKRGRVGPFFLKKSSRKNSNILQQLCLNSPYVLIGTMDHSHFSSFSIVQSKQINAENDLSSIRCLDSNSRPLDISSHDHKTRALLTTTFVHSVSMRGHRMQKLTENAKCTSIFFLLTVSTFNPQSFVQITSTFVQISLPSIFLFSLLRTFTYLLVFTCRYSLIKEVL